MLQIIATIMKEIEVMLWGMELGREVVWPEGLKWGWTSQRDWVVLMSSDVLQMQTTVRARETTNY